MLSVGIDIGGMSIKTGLVDENGLIIDSKRSITSKDSKIDVGNIVSDIKTLLHSHSLSEHDIAGIGIGCPGAVSPEKGIVDVFPNLGWYNVPLVEMIKKEFNLPVRISNDANAAVLAETVYGAAKGFKNVIMFTLGTGVGGGVVIDGKLYEGNDGKGAELGHSTLILGGIPCACGRSGCIECYVSATALIRQTKDAMKNNPDSKLWRICNDNIENVNGKAAFDGEMAGDSTAKQVVDTYCKYLSESMMNMFNIFRPEAFILGGGISAQGDNLTKRIKNYCEEHFYGYKLAPKVEILTAKLGNDAGIIGASLLIRK